MDATPLLAAKELAFERDNATVFGPIDFVLNAGQLLCVRGQNGAGKTSLLRVLTGWSAPPNGILLFDGHPQPTARRGRFLAFLGHRDGLKAELSCLDNLMASCGLLGRRARQTPLGTLAIVGLDGYEHTPAGQLSAGQRRRLALARLWLSPAPIWLLDEPYANLDASGIDLVNRMIAAHLRSGGGVLVTSHGPHNAPTLPHQQLDLSGAET